MTTVDGTVVKRVYTPGDLEELKPDTSLPGEYPFTRHARALNQWIMEDGDWRSIDPQNLAPIFAKQRLKVAKAVIDMPDYLKQRNKGRFGGFEELQMEV